MANPEAIRAALGAALRARFDDGYQISDYLLSNPTGPGFEIDIDPEGVLYDQAMGRGLDEWWFVVRGFKAQATDIGSQQTRDEWLASSGPLSVKEALEVDRTLGGACQACRVVEAKAMTFGAASGSTVTYVGAEWRVKIMASG